MEVVEDVSRAVDAPREAARGAFRRGGPASGRRRASPPRAAGTGGRARPGRGVERSGADPRRGGHALLAQKHRLARREPRRASHHHCLALRTSRSGIRWGLLVAAILVLARKQKRADRRRDARVSSISGVSGPRAETLTHRPKQHSAAPTPLSCCAASVAITDRTRQSPSFDEGCARGDGASDAEAPSSCGRVGFGRPLLPPSALARRPGQGCYVSLKPVPCLPTTRT